MSFGQTPDNVVILILLVFAAIPAFFVLVLVGRLLQWILRIKNRDFATFFTLGAIVVAVLGSSLYLDLYGEVTPGSVVKKVEELEYREEGDWRHQFGLTVEYTLPGQGVATAVLSPPVDLFDAVTEGGTLSLRVLNFGEWPSLVRPADQSTLTWLPWRWIGGILALVVALVALWKISKTRVGCLPGVFFVCALATIPFFNKWWEWQRSMDDSLTPLRASTRVERVQRVTWLDPLPGESNDGESWETGFTIPQPYDIVTVRYQPEGYPDWVLGVDAVDAGQPAVQPGMALIVAYSAGDPRQVRLLEASRLHHWVNPLGWVQDQMVNLAIALGFMFASAWVGERLKAWFAGRAEQAHRLSEERRL
jgi:hypothetical protein